MAVSTDTIQMLLRQRQDLREALLDLRKEIEELDANSLDLVNRNIKTAAPPSARTAPEPHKTVAPTEAASPPAPQANAPVPPQALALTLPAPPVTAPSSPDARPAKTDETAAADPPSEPAGEAVAPSPDPASLSGAAPASDADPAHVPKAPVLMADEKPEKTGKHEKAEKRKKAASQTPAETAGARAPDDLIARAESLAAYFLDHPGPVSATDLGALDSAIAVSRKATTAAEKTACHNTLQAAYRKVSAASFGSLGISGTTLVDSRLGARLLWGLPLTIAVLLLVFFPLILISRTLTGEMFQADFAQDLTWCLSAVSAFVWGASGALTLLALSIALWIRRRQYDAGIRLSPFLKAGLGGLLGAGTAMGLALFLPPGTVNNDLALDLTAFFTGLAAAAPLFAGIQRLIGGVTGWLEPKGHPPAAGGKK